MKSPDLPPNSVRVVAAGMIGLAVWALRVRLVGVYGVGFPLKDQWYCEALRIYQPWLGGELSWSMIFEPHVEHRIVWTHLWNLGLFRLGGQWDPMAQMVAQAVIPALTAAGCVWALLAAQSGVIWRSLVILGALLAFGTPCAYENILWGFQSCFAIYVALSLGGLGAAGLAWRHGRLGWAVLLAGLAVPLAMGAGILIGPVLCALTLGVILIEKKISDRSLAMLATGVICLGFSLWLRSESPGTQYAYARSVGQFAQAWLAACAWPNCQVPLLAGLACLPALIFMVQIFRRRALPRAHELFIVGVIFWAVACAASGAWVRGALGSLPPSRYHEFLALLCWANLLALFLVMREWWRHGSRRIKGVGVIITLAWVIAAAAGGARLLEQVFKKELPALQISLAQEFEGFNSILEGTPLEPSATLGLPKLPVYHETVLASRILAPYLPPELQRPPEGITRDRLLRIAPVAPGATWQWRSGEFVTALPAMVVFFNGEPDRMKLALWDGGGARKMDFQPSGRRLGEWSEWLVNAAPGRYRLDVEMLPVPEGVGLILPRSVSAVGYWARWISAPGLPLLEIAGICVACAFLVTRRRQDAGKGQADQPSAP